MVFPYPIKEIHHDKKFVLGVRYVFPDRDYMGHVVFMVNVHQVVVCLPRYILLPLIGPFAANQH